MNAINIQNLSFSFEEELILNSISLSVKKGGIYGLLGPNGSGKTTLLNLLSGVLKSNIGTIELFGGNIDNLDYREKSKLIAVVPQMPSILFGFSVEDYVLLGRNPHLSFWESEGYDDEKMMKKSLKMCEIVNLSERKIESLSGGEMQKVLIARALAQETPIMLLDEPTAHLDIRSQISVLNLIQSLVKEYKKTIFLSIHDINLASQYCDHLGILKHNKIVLSGIPEEVMVKEKLESVYEIPIYVTKNPLNNKIIVIPSGKSLFN